MEIKSNLTNKLGQIFNVFYRDIDDEEDLKGKNIGGVHAYCFYESKLLVVYSEKKGYWTPPGGKVEKNESFRDAIRREVKEESNMNILKIRFIGCQDIVESERTISQVRFCCIVEPYGPFVNDPDGDITEIRLIDPKDYKKHYFDWGEIGDHIMERALQIKTIMDLEAGIIE